MMQNHPNKLGLLRSATHLVQHLLAVWVSNLKTRCPQCWREESEAKRDVPDAELARWQRERKAKRDALDAERSRWREKRDFIEHCAKSPEQYCRRKRKLGGLLLRQRMIYRSIKGTINVVGTINSLSVSSLGNALRNQRLVSNVRRASSASAAQIHRRRIKSCGEG